MLKRSRYIAAFKEIMAAPAKTAAVA